MAIRITTAFVIKTDGDSWHILSDHVPGLHLCGRDLAKLLKDVIPMWRHMHKIAPTQVPPPNTAQRKT